MRCFILSRLTYAVVKVLLKSLQSINESSEPSILLKYLAKKLYKNKRRLGSISADISHSHISQRSPSFGN